MRKVRFFHLFPPTFLLLPHTIGLCEARVSRENLTRVKTDGETGLPQLVLHLLLFSLVSTNWGLTSLSHPHSMITYREKGKTHLRPSPPPPNSAIPTHSTLFEHIFHFFFNKRDTTSTFHFIFVFFSCRNKSVWEFCQAAPTFTSIFCSLW